MRRSYRVTEIAVYLTPVEAKIAVLIAQGKTNKEIGFELGYKDPEASARTQVSVALRKLGLPNRTALALWAHGLWPPPKLDEQQILERSFRLKVKEASA